MEQAYHIPVLATETIELLNIKPDGVYIDVTFGGGGHSRLILEKLGSEGRLFGFDQDEDAQKNILDDPRFMFVPHNFRNLKRMLRLEGIRQCDGILADLGVSSHQFDEGERGFSYRFEAELDMRMNRQEGKTAADVLNTYDAEQLQSILGNYGEVRNARTLAQRLVKEREVRPFANIGDLVRITDALYMGHKLRYMSQVFQALRIEVNDEMEALRAFLTQSLEVLSPSGRLAVISYHSLEDRPVKNFLKTGTFDGEHIQDFYGNISRPWNLITRKAIEATQQEITANPRARSAKLRVAEKV